MPRLELTAMDSDLLRLRQEMTADMTRVFYDPNVARAAEIWVERGDLTAARSFELLAGPEVADKFVTLLALTHVRKELLATVELQERLVTHGGDSPDSVQDPAR